MEIKVTGSLYRRYQIAGVRRTALPGQTDHGRQNDRPRPCATQKSSRFHDWHGNIATIAFFGVDASAGTRVDTHLTERVYQHAGIIRLAENADMAIILKPTHQRGSVMTAGNNDRQFRPTRSQFGGE